MIDVAGLVPDAHTGRGLGNAFLDELRQAQAIIHVIDASGGTDIEGTPVDIGEHSADSVPITIVGPNIRVDDVEIFDEFESPKGGLLWVRGNHIIPIILDIMNRSEKFGA